MENNIQRQILYYNEHKDDLLKEYNKKYIVVSPELQVKSFDALSEGFTYGVENFGTPDGTSGSTHPSDNSRH